MKVLHTSDWHIGRTLYGKHRYDEFIHFFDWLLESIVIQKIDVLIISGDIFDTTTPGNKAQELYYNFLFKVSSSCCRHIIITSGNHDSPSFLNAPSEILKHLNIHVVTSPENINDEVITLRDSNGKAECIVCAVPYLRDKDIRLVETGESIEEKNINLVKAIREHYKVVSEYAMSIRENDEPIIAMGHLFATGGKTMDGDGVRELYIGSLAHIGAEIFPSCLNYIALGHLHVPQKIGGFDHIRYCGSPIPMGFGESKQEKIVLTITFEKNIPSIQKLIVPRFQELERVSGNSNDILLRLKELVLCKSDAWLEIEFISDELVGNLQEDIYSVIEGSLLEVRIIKNRSITKKALSVLDHNIELNTLSTNEVFSKCLDAYNVLDSDRPLLTALYKDIIKSLEEEDINQ